MVKRDRAQALQPYGDLTRFNRHRRLLDGVGAEVLSDVSEDYLGLLETSSALYERDGDYAMGIFSSGWCRFMDSASYALAREDDPQKALTSGKWRCHDSCWAISKKAMDERRPVDEPCQGGIRIFAAPIESAGEVVGAINVGFGAPPTDEAELAELAERYGVSVADLRRAAASYHPRSDEIVALAKERLTATARLLGEMVRRSEVEAALRKSESELRLAMEAGRLGPWTLDLATRELRASAQCKQVFGRGPDAPFSFDELIASIPEDDRARLRAAVDHSRETGAAYDLEHRVRRPDGTEGWVMVRGQMMRDAQGRAVHLSGFTLDITDKVRAERDLRLVIDELNHRVKNTLATVQAVAAETLRNEAVGPTAVANLTSRLMALSKAHDVLTEENWAGADLAQIAAQSVGAYRSGANGERISIRGPFVQLAPNSAITLALALHELATNAAKYGALSSPEGRVSLAWTVSEAAAGRRRLSVAWRETGGPPVSPPARTGFGTKLIERGLARSFGGRAALAYPREGLVCELELSLPPLETTA